MKCPGCGVIDNDTIKENEGSVFTYYFSNGKFLLRCSKCGCSFRASTMEVVLEENIDRG